MARIPFSKWQGTGNDFIVVDDREGRFPSEDLDLVRRLCDRHFGVGSDGLILVQAPGSPDTAYHMEFFNPDASRSFCGNGSRCAFAFYATLLPSGHQPGTVRFSAIDGEHTGTWRDGLVTIAMRDVGVNERISEHIDYMHTGSPHLLVWVEDPETVDLIPEAHAHRYGERFRREGVNVNFLRWNEGRVEMRTYERGVEGETLSCGTGVTAAALSAMGRGLVTGVCEVRTRGGDLRVTASREGHGFNHITLAGPAVHVFDGAWNV